MIARHRAGWTCSPTPTTRTASGLFAVVREAVAAGVDPEAALRRTARAYRAAIRAAELE